MGSSCARTTLGRPRGGSASMAGWARGASEDVGMRDGQLLQRRRDAYCTTLPSRRSTAPSPAAARVAVPFSRLEMHRRPRPILRRRTLRRAGASRFESRSGRQKAPSRRMTRRISPGFASPTRDSRAIEPPRAFTHHRHRWLRAPPLAPPRAPLSVRARAPPREARIPPRRARRQTAR